MKRTLLLGVLPAVFDADRRRHLEVGDGALGGGDAGAKVDAFEPRGHGDVSLQVLAPDFVLPRDLLDRGQ